MIFFRLHNGGRGRMRYTKPTLEPLGSIHSLTLVHGRGRGNHDPDACSPKSSGKCMGIGDGMSQTGLGSGLS
jgi:hypothetical protein